MSKYGVSCFRLIFSRSMLEIPVSTTNPATSKDRVLTNVISRLDVTKNTPNL